MHPGVSRPALEALQPSDLPVRFGRYRITGILGSGGMARVFKAELEGSAGFRKAVALKVIHRSILQSDDKLVSALMNEARLGALLHHQNLLETYDVGEVDGRHFIALEYVDGLTLNRFLETVGPPPLSACLELGCQMAQGLDAAHSIRIDGRPAALVHRDLKPSNVMLNRQGVVKILDFGIAKAFVGRTGSTETGVVKGTPMYMSPEQAQGKALDGRSDLFSLGAILYELVTGRRLFFGPTVVAVMLHIVDVEARLRGDPHFEAVRTSHPRLADLLWSCLRRDPDDRVESAALVASELTTLRQDYGAGDGLRDVVQLAVGDSIVGPGPAGEGAMEPTPSPAQALPMQDAPTDPVAPLDSPPPADPLAEGLSFFDDVAPLGGDRPTMESLPRPSTPRSMDPVGPDASSELTRPMPALGAALNPDEVHTRLAPPLGATPPPDEVHTRLVPAVGAHSIAPGSTRPLAIIGRPSTVHEPTRPLAPFDAAPIAPAPPRPLAPPPAPVDDEDEDWRPPARRGRAVGGGLVIGLILGTLYLAMSTPNRPEPASTTDGPAEPSRAAATEGGEPEPSDPAFSLPQGGLGPERDRRLQTLGRWTADLGVAELAEGPRRLDLLDALLHRSHEAPLSEADADLLIGTGPEALAERGTTTVLDPMEEAVVREIRTLDVRDVRNPRVRAASIRAVVEKRRRTEGK